MTDNEEIAKEVIEAVVEMKLSNRYSLCDTFENYVNRKEKKGKSEN